MKLIIFITYIVLANSGSVDLKTRIKTEENYRTPNIPANRIYSIEVNRVDSDKAQEISRCWSVPRAIKVTHNQQLFRMSKKSTAQNRQQMVYQKLTNLNQQQNIIEEFQIIGDKIFLLTSDGFGYFISLNKPDQVHKVETNFFSNSNERSQDLIVLRQYKERALVISHKKIVLCKYEKKICDEVIGYPNITKFRGAQLFEENGKYFLFIISSSEIFRFQLTANGQLKNDKRYDKSLFGVQKISFRSIVRSATNSLFILDDFQGIWEITATKGLSEELTCNKKIVFQQFGCYQMISQSKGQNFIIACNPSFNNFFMMNLVRSTQFGQPTYQPLQTVFMHEQMYQIQAVEDILLSRVYSGLKIFWSSKQIGNPYPFFHRNAGKIFLHNAIQSKLKVIEGVKTVFIAAQDELLKYQLKSFDPYVTCYSPIQVNQQYKLIYSTQCAESSFMGRENICKKQQYLHFQTWEHKQVKVTTTVLPFILSFGGVILVAFAVFKIYKKNQLDVSEARKKYNIAQDQIDL